MRIRKVNQTTPTQAQVIDSLNGNSTTNAPSQRAVNSMITKIDDTNGSTIKLYNGLAIQTKKIPVNIAVNTSWQGHYISSSISIANFPINFVTMFSRTVTLETSNSKNAWIMSDGANAIRIISPESISSFTGYINVIAIGTWE